MKVTGGHLDILSVYQSTISLSLQALFGGRGGSPIEQSLSGQAISDRADHNMLHVCLSVADGDGLI